LCLSGLLAAWSADPVLAQPSSSGSEPDIAGAPDPILVIPIHEGGVLKNRGINIPINLRTAPQRRITVGYTASNSYLNPDLLVCRGQPCRVEYQTDHTGNLPFVDLYQPLAQRWELGIGVGAYQMGKVAAWSPLHQLVTDAALRGFHEHILGADSLPSLSHAADGNQIFSMTDLDERKLTLEPTRFYALPLRIDLTRYFDIRRSARANSSLNWGLHLSYPLEGDSGTGEGQAALARGADFGVSVNFIRSLRITANLSSTFHVQLARFRSNVHVVNADSPRNGDREIRTAYALTYGLRFANTFRGRAPCSFAMSQITNSAHYDKDRYWAWDPLLFEGGNNLRGALAGANDFGVLSFACEQGVRQYQVAFVEDIGGFSQIVEEDGAGPSYDPDFAVSVSVSWNLRARRAGSSAPSE
jgi:hypothetical protein